MSAQTFEFDRKITYFTSRPTSLFRGTYIEIFHVIIRLGSYYDVELTV